MAWTLFSLFRLSRRAHLLTTSRWLVVVLPVAVVRSPRGGPPDVPFLPSMDRPADANGGLCVGQSCADALEAWGPRPPTSGTGYIPVHFLPLLSAHQMRLVYWSLLCYTDGCKKTTKREFRGMMPYEEKCFNIVDSCSCNSWIFS